MNVRNILVAVTLSSLTAGVALAKGEKCWNADGSENTTATKAKECKKSGGKWAKKAPAASKTAPAAATTTTTTPPPADTTAAPAAEPAK